MSFSVLCESDIGTLIADRFSTNPPSHHRLARSVSGGFENNRSFNPFVHGLEVGGRAARVPAKCQTIAARTIVATWGIGHRSIGPTGQPGIRPLLGAAGRRTSLAAATKRGPSRTPLGVSKSVCSLSPRPLRLRVRIPSRTLRTLRDDNQPRLADTKAFLFRRSSVRQTCGDLPNLRLKTVQRQAGDWKPQ